MDERRYRWAAARTWILAALVACGIVALVFSQWYRSRGGSLASLREAADCSSLGRLDPEAEARIVAFCADCHALPRPESFPRDRWQQGVRLGYEYYARSGRNDLDPPPIHLAVAYFRSRAPQRLEFPRPREAETDPPVRFTVEKLQWDRGDAPPAVSHLGWARLDSDARPTLLVGDMREGTVAAVDLHGARRDRRVLARLDFPCRVEPCDLDRDGAIDLVVADLGSFCAADHDEGRVVWLRRMGQADGYEEVVLASGLGRIADVRAADFDGDGDLDLLVAEFGHYRTGGIHFLENVAPRGEPPRFASQKIDLRPGTIHVPVHDFDGDGRLDFMALVSQEHECLDVFLNPPDAAFHRYTVWAAPDLAFGSSGIELVDLDRDEDVDVLYTNGDAFDNLYAVPWHGVQWLENLGGLEFAQHRLTDLPGAYRALAGDFDLDGDLDVVVCAWLPQQVMPPGLRETPLASIVFLEQTSPGRFARHTLEKGSAHYATMVVGDFDGDGDLDFAVGSHAGLDGPKSARAMPDVAVWWNQAISNGK